MSSNLDGACRSGLRPHARTGTGGSSGSSSGSGGAAMRSPMVCQKGLPLVQYDFNSTDYLDFPCAVGSTWTLTGRTASCDSSWYRPGERQGIKMSCRVDGCGYLDAKLGIQRLP